MKIPFNQPYLTGNETRYISQAVQLGKIAGNGVFTQKCQQLLEEKYHFKKVFLTTSCTDALEMIAILANIQEGDEVIIPSFTFVSTALAFVRQGAKIVFVDSYFDNPNIDVTQIESLITAKTKAIVVMHYAGIACEMDEVMLLAEKYNLLVIEDAAQAIDAFYKGKALGSIGHLAAFSFHETKNITSGEGGMLVINDERFVKRAEIIWEKGTNRSNFFRGEVDKYEWVDVGSSFLPSEITAAFLYAQLENIANIQEKRSKLWQYYQDKLNPLIEKKYFSVIEVPSYASNNAHIFYLLCHSSKERTMLIKELKKHHISAVFHYQSLHKSEYYKNKHDGRVLPNSDKFTDCLVRLPLFYELSKENIDEIAGIIENFYENLTHAKTLHHHHQLQ